jgi:hypothetical protein
MTQVPSVPGTPPAEFHTLSSGERLENEIYSTSDDAFSYKVRRMTGLPSERCIYTSRCSYEDNDAKVRKAEEFIASDLFRDYRNQLLRWARPATKAEIAKSMVLLVGSFTGKPANPKVFAVMLLEDVAAQCPSLLAVDIASRRLRRSSRFLPSISEVIQAINEAEHRVKIYAEVVEKLPGQVAASRTFVERHRLRHTPVAPPNAP